MEVYTTENDQVDAVRRFFSENGKALAVGVVLGIGALVGWRYWQGNQNTAMTEASSAYQKSVLLCQLTVRVMLVLIALLSLKSLFRAIKITTAYSSG